MQIVWFWWVKVFWYFFLSFVVVKVLKTCWLFVCLFCFFAIHAVFYFQKTGIIFFLIVIIIFTREVYRKSRRRIVWNLLKLDLNSIVGEGGVNSLPTCTARVRFHPFQRRCLGWSKKKKKSGCRPCILWGLERKSRQSGRRWEENFRRLLMEPLSARGISRCSESLVHSFQQNLTWVIGREPLLSRWDRHSFVCSEFDAISDIFTGPWFITLYLLWWPSICIKTVNSISVSSFEWFIDIWPLFSLKSTCEQSDLLAYDCNSRRRHCSRRYGHQHFRHHRRRQSRRQLNKWWNVSRAATSISVALRGYCSGVSSLKYSGLFRCILFSSFLSLSRLWFGFCPSIAKLVFFWLQLRRRWANHCGLKSLHLIDPKTVIVMWLLIVYKWLCRDKVLRPIAKEFFSWLAVKIKP